MNGRMLRAAAEPLALRCKAWQGDPLAALMTSGKNVLPYPLYERIREQSCVRSSLGAYVTARHDIVSAALRDKRFSTAHRPGIPSLLSMDGTEHARIRKLASGAFTPQKVALLEPDIRKIVSALLHDAGKRGTFDLIDALAYPLPVAVICRMLDVPAEDEARFRDWGRALVPSLEPRARRSAVRKIIQARQELEAYLRELVRIKRGMTGNSSLLSVLMQAHEGDNLTEGELVSLLLLLLIAGFETTVNLIGNGTAALLSTPGAWEELRSSPALIPNAVEELLRYDSPVQRTTRITTDSVRAGNMTIPRGAYVVLLLGGANRDPEIFERPDELQLARANARQHLSFGSGSHYCLGAGLARLEAQMVFEELSLRFPDLALTGKAQRKSLRVLRGYETLPVRG
jgi:cytochrome P450